VTDYTPPAVHTFFRKQKIRDIGWTFLSRQVKSKRLKAYLFDSGASLSSVNELGGR
jgi:hypothetical protein